MGTTEGTHGEQTDSDETIPDGGRRYVRVRWQDLSVSALQDYYSRYIKVERLYSTRASFIIMKMKGIMVRHDIPEQVFSDNGPQFSCAEFAQFANTWGFVHSTSSPRYPQSNGLAEKAVQTAKRIVMKATASGRDPYIALLEYRTTPISDCGKSSAQLLMSRRLRYILPSTPASLQPVFGNPEDIQLRFEEKKYKQKTVYDRNARTRASISVGDQILMIKNSGGYQSAVVTEKADATRSYNVRTKDGAIYRRTSRHLKKPRHYAGEVPRTSAPEARVRSHVNHNCRSLDVRQSQLCCHRSHPQKYLWRTFTTFPK